MATGIDHIVIAVRDLNQTVADYTAAGFTVTPGGEHTNGETHNALVAFSDGAYFELIAWKNPDKVQDTDWWRRLQVSEGLIDFALRTADIDAEVERLRAAGLDTPDPAPGGRVRPDGQRVDWKTIRFDAATHPSLPFYCHSTNDRALRVPSGAAAVHANGVTGVGTVFVGVKDLDQAAEDWGKVAGIGFTEESHKHPEANRWHSYKVGTVTITLVEPEHADSPLAKTIAAKGDVPIEIALKSYNSQGSAIDHNLTHGAKLAIVP
jgi:hypothetical protein